MLVGAWIRITKVGMKSSGQIEGLEDGHTKFGDIFRCEKRRVQNVLSKIVYSASLGDTETSGKIDFHKRVNVIVPNTKCWVNNENSFNYFSV